MRALIQMKNCCLAIVALFITGTASAGIPIFVALCPGDISVDSGKNGVVHVNGSKAAVEKFDHNYYEAKSGAVTISVSANGNKAPDVSFTGKGHANGICQVTRFEPSKSEAARATAGSS